MSSLSTDSLEPDLAATVTPFFQEILDKYPPNIHSLYLVGSVLTADFIEKMSDINSIIVLKEMDLAFLDVLAPLGKTYRQQGFAAPLIMDPVYIAGSLDVFPIEFLTFKLIHRTLWGEDLLAGLEIGAGDVKRQAEREIKGKLMWLRRGYVSAAGRGSASVA